MATPGDFSTLPLKDHDKKMFSDAYDTVSSLNLWDWLRDPTNPGEDGFMFGASWEIMKIGDTMKFTGHSGSSFAFTMRVMEKIAKKGWENYVKEVNYWSACSCHRKQNKPGWCGVAGGGVPGCEH